MTLAWAVLTLFAIAIFLIFSALVELYRTIEQIRAETGVTDAEIISLADVSRNRLLDQSIGLPNFLFTRERALLIALSDKCTTCKLIAERLSGEVPGGVALLLLSNTAESGQKWLARFSLADDPQVIRDNSNISDAIGISVTPAVVRLRKGAVVAAHTLPSGRRLGEELKWLRHDGTDEPNYSSDYRQGQSLGDMINPS